MTDFAHSRWNTTYQTPGGPQLAIVNFNDDKGSYDIVDSAGNVIDSGLMDNVKYFVTSDSVWIITGHWSIDAVTGAFQFTSAGGPDDFTGGWLFTPPHSGGGAWTGHRI
jgi:hypothetical protein